MAVLVVGLFLLNGFAPPVLASPITPAAPTAARGAPSNPSPATASVGVPSYIPYSHALNGSEFSAAYLKQCEVRACPLGRPGEMFQASAPTQADFCASPAIQLTAPPFSGDLKLGSSTGSGAKLNLTYDVTASGSLGVCAGVAEQSIRITFFGSCLFCITVPTGLNWINFTEQYAESVTANLSVTSHGHNGFSTGDLGGPPKSLASVNILNVPICCGPVPIVNLNLNLILGLEYQLTFDHGSWLNFSQGSAGTYSQNYSFSSGTWNDHTHTACTNGASLSALCTSIKYSPSFGGSVLVRIGPELALTLSAGINTGIFSLNLASITFWAFLYGQASLFFGVGSSPSVYTGCGNTRSKCTQVNQGGPGGSCGSNSDGVPYQVWGLNPDPIYPWGEKGDPTAGNFWIVACAGVGFQFGGSFNIFTFTLENPLHSIGIGPPNIFTWTLWHGKLFSSLTWYIYNGTLATSMDLCDVTQGNCSATFTGTTTIDGFAGPWADNGTAANPGPWEIVNQTTGPTPPNPPEVLVVDTALHNETPGGRLPCPPCGSSFSLANLSDAEKPGLSWNTWWVSPALPGECGTILPDNATIPVLPDDRGPWNVFNYTPPRTDGLCAISFNVNPFAPIQIPNLEISNVTVLIRIVPPPGPEYKTTFVPSCDAPLCNDLEYESGVWSVSVYAKSGGTNGAGATEGTTPVATESAAWNQNLTVPRLPNGVYNYTITPPADVTAAPISGTFTIDYANHVIPVNLTYLEVKFNEKGLPTGTSWSAEIDGRSVASSGAWLDINTTSGKYSYTVPEVSGCMISSGAKGTATVTTHSPTVHVVFLCSGSPAGSSESAVAPTVYPVQLAETGLPTTDDLWYAFVAPGLVLGGAQPTFDLSLPNGTYSLIATGPAGYTWNQPASSGPLSFTVNGASEVVPVVFLPFTYAVTLTEFGLPSGTTWTVTISDATHTSSHTVSSDHVTVELANGTGHPPFYTYAIQPIPGYTVVNGSWSGGFDVNGANASIVVELSPTYYTVTFVEYGLVPAPGQLFSVAFNGTRSESVTTLNTSTAVSFNQVPNGTYSFAIGPVAGYTTLYAYGTVIVDGGTVPVDVYFLDSTTYTVTFVETGLPLGTEWTAGAYDPIFGANRSSSGSDIQFNLTPGLYAYFANTTDTEFTSCPNYVGLFTVLDAAITIPIRFNSTAPNGNNTNCSTAPTGPAAPPSALPPGDAGPSVAAGGAAVFSSAPQAVPRIVSVRSTGDGQPSSPLTARAERRRLRDRA